MREPATESAGTTGDRPRTLGADVVAVVVTYRRPQLAGDVVRNLVGVEGFESAQVVLVVNGEGGLDDPELERSVRLVRLAENLGPAGGFRAGLLAAFRDPGVRWAYLCEDDIGLFDLPTPRVARVLRAVSELSGPRPGAVAAYGRSFVRGRGHTLPHVADPAGPALQPVDAAAWGATLVHREVVESGVLPDTDLFFGYEDFDFFLSMQHRGFELVADRDSEVDVAAQTSLVGRDDAIRGRRPTDMQEPWRSYYVARNFFPLARRYGSVRWLLWHLVYSVRRVQLARSWAVLRATSAGLWDGARGRSGRNSRFVRETGEWRR